MTLIPRPPASYSSVSRCAVKRLLPCLFLLGILLLPGSLYASVWAYTWIQYDEYPEQIDVYGATHISGSYQEQYYYDFAIYGVLYANGQLVDSDYEGWTCEGATAYVSVQGQHGTLYEFFGICDLKIYFHDICYPWWYDLGYYWYVSNPLYSPDAGIWEPFDPICLDDVLLPSIGIIYATTVLPKVEITFADVTQDTIHIILTPGNQSGTLSISLTGPAYHVIRQAPRSSRSHNETFDIPNLSPGEYSQVKATWTLAGGAHSAYYNHHIKVLGMYNHTRYNLFSENQCGGDSVNYSSTGPGDCINIPNCNYSTAAGRSQWLSEVQENGGGYSTSGRYVSWEWECTAVPPPRLRILNFAAGCPRCQGLPLGNDTVAVAPNHDDLKCGDRVFIHEIGTKTVTDVGGNLAANQLDHYAGLGPCNGASTIGQKMTIKLFN